MGEGGGASGANAYAADNPYVNPYAGSANPYAAAAANPYAGGGAAGGNPYAANANAYPAVTNPYAAANPSAGVDNPYAAENAYGNPYAAPPPPQQQAQGYPSYPTPATGQAPAFDAPPEASYTKPPAAKASDGAHYSGGGAAAADYVIDLDDADGAGAGGDGGTAATNLPSSGLMSDAKVRNGFLRKVYGILTLQLLFTGGACAAFSFVDTLQRFSIDYYWMLYVMLIPTIACLIGLMYVTKRYPLNMVLLSLFTVFESFTLGILCGQWSTNIGGWGVMGCFTVTAAVMVLITIFVAITKADFSFLALFLVAGMFIVGFSFFIWWIVSLATNNINLWAVFGITLAGALVIVGYICYDTSQIVLKFSPDDYIEATVTLYIDFIMLFQCLLCLVGLGAN